MNCASVKVYYGSIRSYSHHFKELKEIHEILQCNFKNLFIEYVIFNEFF